MSLLAVLSALLQKWVNWNENSVSLFYYYQNNYYFWATYVGQLSFQQSWAHIVIFVASTGERAAVLGQSPGEGSVALLFTPQEGPFFRGSGNNSRSPDAVTRWRRKICAGPALHSNVYYLNSWCISLIQTVGMAKLCCIHQPGVPGQGIIKPVHRRLINTEEKAKVVAAG